MILVRYTNRTFTTSFLSIPSRAQEFIKWFIFTVKNVLPYSLGSSVFQDQNTLLSFYMIHKVDRFRSDKPIQTVSTLVQDLGVLAFLQVDQVSGIE